MSQLAGENKASSQVTASIVGSVLQKIKQELDEYKGNKEEVYKDILEYEGDMMNEQMH